MSFLERYIRFQYDAANQLLISEWHTTPDMTDEECRQVALQYLRACEKYRPRLSLVDSRYAMYVIPPETQDWLSQYLYPKCMATGIYKVAYLVIKDFYTQLSLELTLSEAEESNKPVGVQQRFFDDFDTAKAWLLQ
jgi:hypothetical protein